MMIVRVQTVVVTLVTGLSIRIWIDKTARDPWQVVVKQILDQLSNHKLL